MSDEEAIPPLGSDLSAVCQTTEKERQELLERIWLAEARAALAILEKTPADELQAATLNTIRQFLGDNGINIQSFKGPPRVLWRLKMLARPFAGLRLRTRSCPRLHPTMPKLRRPLKAPHSPPTVQHDVPATGATS